MRSSIALSIIWCCFLAKALFFCTVIPLWEGYDEYSHFAMIQYVALHRGLPDASMNSSREVAESRKLVPAGDWTAADHTNRLLSYEGYWRLPPAERERLRVGLRSLPAAWRSEEAQPRLAMYEAQQAPLYYWIIAPVYRLVQASPLTTRVWILRCLTAVLASLVIPAGFFMARQVCGSTMVPLGIALILASMPELFISACRVGNEGLAIGLGSFAVLAIMRQHHSSPSPVRGVCFGIVLGATLLTKAYFLVLLPLSVVALIRAWHRDPVRRRRDFLELLIMLVVCLAISGWWYGRNLWMTHSLTGEQIEVAATTHSIISLPQAMVRTPWRRVLDFLLVSYIWIGDGSFLVVRSWMYRVVEWIWIFSLAGVLLQICDWREGLDSRLDLLLVLLAPATLLLGLCFHAAQTMQATGIPGTLGHYMYALGAPEGILLVVGLQWWLPYRWRTLPVPLLVTVFAGLDLFTSWFLLLPYYTGIIQHDVQGRLHALHVTQLAHGGLKILFERLIVNGPEFVSVGGVTVMAAVGLIATGYLITISYWIGKQVITKT